ncbi:hypothetical protein OOJ09_02700 [Mesorhizobium qingshengii]|uniref:Uncharacterized protein n=1 Tax=Mesorhizobium qingshengii TaxID=1165689 RepID=A0ABT4QNF6_9HYPH|nr:hypothetical protein [Mesorhizobium qingshengii]MCZ8543076.1 hypothetical protein [Mesorhizobium qingshengii]
MAHGYIDSNPTADMSLAKKKERSTLPFASDQLNTVFKSPLFTGCQSGGEWRNVAKPGNVMIRDHRYWVPLVMLYSGARPKLRSSPLSTFAMSTFTGSCTSPRKATATRAHARDVHTSLKRGRVIRPDPIWHRARMINPRPSLCRRHLPR